jgi:nucleobase:cation symporter-1, NCS1 family
MASHATQGPVLGLPQMIQSRAQFGFRLLLLPLIGTLFTFVGFNVVDVVIIKFGTAAELRL